MAKALLFPPGTTKRLPVKCIGQALRSPLRRSGLFHPGALVHLQDSILVYVPYMYIYVYIYIYTYVCAYT